MSPQYAGPMSQWDGDREVKFENRFLSGAELWGDDMGDADLLAWYRAEEEGYATLVDGTDPDSARAAEHGYGYGPLNQWHGFRRLPPKHFESALGLGSSYGDEFLPIAGRLEALTIVEPSKTLRSTSVGPLTPTYLDPSPSGDLPCATSSFDLIVCLGVLHHIPNVTHVIGEMARVAKPESWLLLREPVVSMGDWRHARSGLTSRERGIPRRYLERVIEDAGFRLHRAAWCAFPTTSRLGTLNHRLGFGGRPGVWLDATLSKLSSPNYRYHPRSRIQKIRPTSVFYVAQFTGSSEGSESSPG